MSLHLYRDLDALRNRLLQLGGLVERSIADATAAFLQRDAERARQVVRGDREVDTAEVRIEEDCLKVLALHQPVAGDLRFVVAVLKVNTDLERMGDAAESIAARAIQLAALPAFALPEEFPHMVTMASGMAQKAMESLRQEDTALARRVLEDDVIVDSALRRMFEVLQERMRNHPDDVEAAVLTLSTSRQVERIADLATNIAEDVVFLHDGEIVRHKRSQLRLV
ncbi:MAG: phosphate signaling complex protein PhoU [Planctomycetes bacterium]|nr:phosphate signaling complex protein PhoU [Planctomycetota bacterium]